MWSSEPGMYRTLDFLILGHDKPGSVAWMSHVCAFYMTFLKPLLRDSSFSRPPTTILLSMIPLINYTLDIFESVYLFLCV